MQQHVREYFARRPDPYAGGVVEISRRIGGGVALVSASISLLLLPFAPPTQDIGPAGWALAATAIGATAWEAFTTLRPNSVADWERIALMQWVGLAALALLVWLTGGNESPQTTLLLLWIVVFAACHPPRRALGYLAVAGLVTVAPLSYDSAGLVPAGQAAAQLAVWFSMAAVANLWVVSVRADRLQRIQNEEQATTLARVDPLTRLGNRRAFDESLTSLVSRAREEARPLGLVIADLDGFKQINDRFGHLNGDRCLQAVARAISSAVRASELTYRWGGDEFAVLLPGTDYAGAANVGSRLIETVSTECSAPDGTPLNLACGCAELEADMTASELVAAADLALLARKVERGRA